MAKNSITSYSTTAASNTDVGGVDVQGTAPASNMDDSVREVMSHLAETNAGTAPWADTMTIGDAADLTKEVRFELSAITAGQTRVITLPDANITLPSGTYVTETGTQTLTNKTLTSPTINSPTIVTPAVTSSVTITRTDNGTSGAQLTLDHDSASPAADDAVAIIRGQGDDSAGNSEIYADIRVAITDPTSGSEDGRIEFLTVVAGSLGHRFRVGAGLYSPSATGGDPGGGKINATEVQENGVALGYKTIVLPVVATTSGTSKDVTDIPAWATEINIALNGVSGNGTADMLVQIGDSGGIETTGYDSRAGVGGDVDTSTAGFIITNNNDAAYGQFGRVTLQLMDAATNTWVMGGSTMRSTSGFGNYVGGSKSLSATLDRLRLTFVGGTVAFDAGSFGVSYR